MAVFDGPLSRELAFGTATRDSESFLAAVKAIGRALDAASGRRLVLAASDGELYGHHKKFADLTLAHAAAVEARAARGHRGDQPGRLPARRAADLGGRAGQGPRRRRDRLELRPRPGPLAAPLRLRHALARRERLEPGLARAAAGGAGSPARRGGGVLRGRGRRSVRRSLGGARRLRRGARRRRPRSAMRFLAARAGAPALCAAASRAPARGRCCCWRCSGRPCSMYASCGWFFDDVAGHRERAGHPPGGLRPGSVEGAGRQAARPRRCSTGWPRPAATSPRPAPAPTSSAGWSSTAPPPPTRWRPWRWPSWPAPSRAPPPTSDVAGFAIDRPRPKPKAAPAVKGKADGAPPAHRRHRGR